MERICLGHLSIDNYQRDELVESLVQKAVHSNKTHLVATINAQFYVLSANEPEFSECLRRAEYLCADGFSVSVATRWLTGKSVERTPGVDLVGKVCARGALKGLRVFFLGGQPGSAQRTADDLAASYPGLEVVGVACPDHGFESDSEVLDRLLAQIAEAAPQVIFVGLGAPKQELFIDYHLRSLRVPVAIGVGGSFEILSGRLKRAPVWMRQIGMEWVFRLGQEPGRLWKRYCLGNAEFLWLVSRQYLRTRLYGTPQAMGQ